MADTYTKQQLKLIIDRDEWEKQYTHFLNRKNKFAIKLADAGRTTNGSKTYAKLDTEVKKYFGLLRDSLPAYKQLFVQRHK